MDNSTKLSILIPTYNRSEYLTKLLDSITDQTKNNYDIEVLISDNASTDETEIIGTKYSTKHKYIKYNRNNCNIGFDNNAIKLIKMAKGEYLWMIGSDDWLEYGAILRVLKCIKESPNITGISSEINTYDKYGTPIIIIKPENDQQLLYGISDIYSYNKLGYRFGFISAHIFKRDLANTVINENKIEINFHPIHFILSKLVSTSPTWIFLHNPLVAWRSGNDSFLNNNGIYKRYLIDINAYLNNVNNTFPCNNSIVSEFINNQLMYCVRGYLVNGSKVANDISDIRLDAIQRFWKYRNFWILIFPLLILPSRLIKVISNIKRKIK